VGEEGGRDARGVEWLWARFDRAVQARRPDREILPFAFALPGNRATWERVAAAGPELDRAYWLRLRSFCIPCDEDFHVVVDKYLAVGRGRAALEMISARHDIRVASSDILRVLRDPSTVKTDGDAIDPSDQMLTYYVGCAFKRLGSGLSGPTLTLCSSPTGRRAPYTRRFPSNRSSSSNYSRQCSPQTIMRRPMIPSRLRRPEPSRSKSSASLTNGSAFRAATIGA
jgi:hypothetical protein